MGDHDDGFVEFGAQAFEEVEHFRGTGGIQVAGGFVGEDHIGIGDDGAGDGDALLLAAGKLAGEVVEAIVQADELERGLGILAARRRGKAA